MSSGIGPAPGPDDAAHTLQGQLVKAGLAAAAEEGELIVPPSQQSAEEGPKVPPKPKKKGKGADSAPLPEAPGPMAQAQEDSVVEFPTAETIEAPDISRQEETGMEMSERAQQVVVDVSLGRATKADQEFLLGWLASPEGRFDLAGKEGISLALAHKVGEEAKAILASGLSPEMVQQRLAALLVTIGTAANAAGLRQVVGIEVLRSGSGRNAAIYNVKMADGSSQVFLGGKKNGGSAGDAEFAKLMSEMAGMAIGMSLASWAAGKIAAALGLEAGSLGAILLTSLGIAGGAVGGMYAGKKLYEKFCD